MKKTTTLLPLLLASCITLRDPARKPAELQAQKTYSDWTKVLQADTQIVDLRILHTGAVEVPLSGMLNLRDSRMKHEQNRRIFVDVFAVWFCHKSRGCYLIDSGLDETFQHGGNVRGFFASDYISGTRQEPGQDIRSQLSKMSATPRGVFFTHLHGDHTSGVPALPKGLEYYVGAGEKYINYWLLYYGNHLDAVPEMREVDIQQGKETPILGKVVDLFGDGSFFAIGTPGHSNAHLSYLLRTPQGPYLFTGDASHTCRGFDLGVEPGWTDDRKQAIASLDKLRTFARAYPAVKVVCGHELPAARR